MKSKIERFLQLLKQKRFFDAHEALEEVWFPRRFEDDNEVRLLKGFINASVSFELAKRGKAKQSAQVWKNYLKYRALLYKTSSLNYNLFHKTVREIDSIYKDFK